MSRKVDALAEISPAGVIEMYAARFPKMLPSNRTEAIVYLRNYAIVFYSPEEVPAHITQKINELETKTWPEAQ